MQLFILISLVLSFVAYLRAGRSASLIQSLLERVAVLELENGKLRKSVPAPSEFTEPQTATTTSHAGPQKTEPPALSPEFVPRKSQRPAPMAAAKTKTQNPEPPFIPQPAPSQKKVAVINWEQFMGAKLFAWIGGLALFLGIVFFVKYSFERNLISPKMRVGIGFVTGLGLLAGGIRMRRRAVYSVTSQTLCATGIVVLYACSYAARSLNLLGAIETFGLMSAITVAAFILAVRMNAQVVALLGMLGGFLTPLLLSSGYDNPLGLFGYIALLDAGLLAVALYRQWYYLTFLGAIGTLLMESAWTLRFFVPEEYYYGNRIFVPMTIFAGFSMLFLAAQLVAKCRRQINGFLTWSTLAIAAVAIGFTGLFLCFPSLAARPTLIFGYLFGIDLIVLVTVFLDERRAALQPVFGLVVFMFLAIWTSALMTPDLLNTGLAFYFLFAVFHSVSPILLQRFGKVPRLGSWTHAFSVLSLLMVLLPMSETIGVSFMVWPFVSLIDLLAIIVAVAAGTLVPVLLVFLLTLVVLGAWMARIPITLEGLPVSLLLLGGFAVFFFVIGILAARILSKSSDINRSGDLSRALGNLSAPESITALLPVCSCVLPFLLLIMATVRLPITNPSPLFGLALILGVLLLASTRILKVQGLPLCGLLATTALEHVWHANHFNYAAAGLPLGWYLGFYALFTLYPYLFEKAEGKENLSWAAAALSGPLHFYLILRLVEDAYPNRAMGLLPASFAIVSFTGFIFLVRQISRERYSDSAALAWFGGVTLFFITLIFPIQFENEWVTIGWALEGAALCWLFHRIAHPGLRGVGVGLLVASFIRLALNAAVLEYHTRSNSPVFNWYLYAYGIVCAALFAGARLLAPPRNIVAGSNVPPLLYGLGTTLAFLLINIEIADFFTHPDSPVVTFHFSGNLARDMSYSIAWALFALMLVITGMQKKLAPVRYAGVALLSVTILKLFFHDTSKLDDLYRIGAFILVAVVAIVAAFLYQRFIANSAKPVSEGESV
ncbi:MAG: hypothetical protein JWL59_2192 [Chthoniobacteraceae bacterium]|nr:hypothetical protein [Chthoniobacteraceae bacterium]